MNLYANISLLIFQKLVIDWVAITTLGIVIEIVAENYICPM